VSLDATPSKRMPPPEGQQTDGRKSMGVSRPENLAVTWTFTSEQAGYRSYLNVWVSVMMFCLLFRITSLH